MSRITSLLLFIPFVIAACNDKSYTNNNDEQEVKDHWYKRYTGTIAGMPVVVNLFFGGDKSAPNGITVISGNYYYRRKSDLLDLDLDKIKGNEAQLNEYSPEDTDENAKHPKWQVTVDNTAITGTWKNADGSKSYPIQLRENYETGSYAFSVISQQDSVSFKTKKDAYWMHTEYNLLAPSASVIKDDAQFIVQALLHELGGDTLGAKDLTGFITATNKTDFKEYRERETEIFKDTGGWEGESNNWEETMDGTLEYNDRGIVVFGFARYDYSGGAHPNNWSRYVSLDVAGKKVLRLSDILNVDTIRLRSMLEALARKKFDIKPGDSLGSRLLVDTIPLPDNFIISETGLTFHYNPYEIASYVDGDSFYFLSYKQLGNMMKPDFMERMQK